MILDERVRTELASQTRFSDIRLLAETDSTNRVVLDLAQSGAPEGLVVAADRQTAGRGRLDRTWEADAGAGLLVTVLLRPGSLPPQRWHLLTAAVALAARAACTELAGVTPDLKWPNDLLIGDAKLAGVLAESAHGAVAVGMGLNVHSGPAGSAVLDASAGRRVGRAELLVAWLGTLDGLLGAWDETARLYREHCSTVGRQVLVSQPGRADLEGLAEGVDEDGRLLVRTGEDRLVRLAAGDVTHVRRARSAEDAC